MMRSTNRLSMAAAALLLAACSSGTDTASQISVQLTDAPVDDIQSATVWVNRVYVIGGSDSTGSRYTILSTRLTAEVSDRPRYMSGTT